jgi:hypothetical protein
MYKQIGGVIIERVWQHENQGHFGIDSTNSVGNSVF